MTSFQNVPAYSGSTHAGLQHASIEENMEGMALPGPAFSLLAGAPTPPPLNRPNGEGGKNGVSSFQPKATESPKPPHAPPPFRLEATNQTGLPDKLKNGIEQHSGFSMDDVRVRFNSPEPEKLEAHAFARGTEIYLAPGQEKHLPHEAWHVAQQKQGRVKATTQFKGKGINDDTVLEREADIMGAKALQKAPEAYPAQKLSQRPLSHGVVQGVFFYQGKKFTDLKDPELRKIMRMLDRLRGQFPPDKYWGHKILKFVNASPAKLSGNSPKELFDTLSRIPGIPAKAKSKNSKVPLGKASARVGPKSPATGKIILHQVSAPPKSGSKPTRKKRSTSSGGAPKKKGKNSRLLPGYKGYLPRLANVDVGSRVNYKTDRYFRSERRIRRRMFRNKKSLGGRNLYMIRYRKPSGAFLKVVTVSHPPGSLCPAHRTWDPDMLAANFITGHSEKISHLLETSSKKLKGAVRTHERTTREQCQVCTYNYPTKHGADHGFGFRYSSTDQHIQNPGLRQLVVGNMGKVPRSGLSAAEKLEFAAAKNSADWARQNQYDQNPLFNRITSEVERESADSSDDYSDDGEDILLDPVLARSLIGANRQVAMGKATLKSISPKDFGPALAKSHQWIRDQIANAGAKKPKSAGNGKKKLLRRPFQRRRPVLKLKTPSSTAATPPLSMPPLRKKPITGAPGAPIPSIGLRGASAPLRGGAPRPIRPPAPGRPKGRASRVYSPFLRKGPQGRRGKWGPKKRGS